MNSKKRVILITDGDSSAKAAVKLVAEKLGYPFIGESGGNPTKISGDELIKLILKTESDPVLVLFDDCGFPEEGPGERAFISVVNSPDIDVIGAVAVASQSFSHEWTKVDISIDRNGLLTEYGVDKDGIKDLEIGRIRGDTVSALDRLPIPLIVGIGDIGKMGGRDSLEMGAPITKLAIEVIMERSGGNGSST
ncbi:stage V sporulation protein AE [Evansella tamaricis]|uniref:Stage V sporulation protein AE n=1 Tax=Evansella tamaricis TaxID=2069301 RepID=A0ABS6JMK6_9BACI|nr:stage V sporulation protein AE [Evansella tamaricis]MBU9714768.1 stage V sporulation protein AE [Evansella tamaricis]